MSDEYQGFVLYQEDGGSVGARLYTSEDRDRFDRDVVQTHLPGSGTNPDTVRGGNWLDEPFRDDDDLDASDKMENHAFSDEVQKRYGLKRSE